LPGKDGTGFFGTGPVAGEAERRGQRGGISSGYMPMCGETVSQATGIPYTTLSFSQCGSTLVTGSYLP